MKWRNLLRVLVCGLALDASALPTYANWLYTPGAGPSAFVSFNSGTTPAGTALCAASNTDCLANVPINTAGSPLFVTGNAGLVTGTGGTFPATQSGTWNITNISGTVSLPTGAATSALQSTINTTLGSPFQAGGSIGNTGFNALQAGSANIAGNPFFVSPGTGATFPVSAASLPLPTGAATSALQTTGNTALTTINTTLGTPMQNSGGSVTANAGTNLNTSALATSANQTNASQKTQIVDGSGNVIASTSNNLNVQCANCSGSGASAADAATFTAGTSVFAPSGGQFTSGGATACVTGHQCVAAITADRSLFSNMADWAGTALGAPSAYGTSPGAVTVPGVNAFVTSSALPTGAATSANQTNASAKTQIVDGSGNVIASTSNNLNVQCANCSGSGVSAADGASFTVGTSLMAPLGAQYTSGGAAACGTGTECTLAATAGRALFTNMASWAGTVLGAPSNYGTSPGAVEVPGVNAFITNTPNVTNTGTFAVQATLQASATTAIGKVDPNTIGNWGLAASTQNGTTPTNGVTVMGQFNTSPTTITSGNISPLQMDNAGNLLVNVKAGASGGTAAADAATFTAGTSNMTPMGAQYTSGGATACVTGHECTLAIGSDRTLFAQLPHAEVAIGGATAPADAVLGGMVYNSGGITPSNGQGLALQSDAAGNLKVVGVGISQASTTSGQTGSLVFGATTTSNPSYTTAQSNPLSLDTAGGLRIAGEGTAGTATGGVVTVQGVASMTPLLANPGTAANWGVVTQGSTTSGQSGNLVQGAVTTSAPSYTTAQTSPLSLDTAGNLRTTITNAALPANITQVAGATISATNPLFTNISVGSAAISATNGLYSNILQGNAVLTTANPIFDRVVAGATGGASTAGAIVPNNTTAVVVKSGAGTLYGLQLYGINAAPLYVKFYNATSATCGSGTPVKRIMIPANPTAANGAGSNVTFGDVGVNFSTGITYCATTGITDADTTAPTANNFLINVDYL